MWEYVAILKQKDCPGDYSVKHTEIYEFNTKILKLCPLKVWATKWSLHF